MLQNLLYQAFCEYEYASTKWTSYFTFQLYSSIILYLKKFKIKTTNILLNFSPFFMSIGTQSIGGKIATFNTVTNLMVLFLFKQINKFNKISLTSLQSLFIIRENVKLINHLFLLIDEYNDFLFI